MDCSPESDEKVKMAIKTTLSEWMVKQPYCSVAFDKQHNYSSERLVAKCNHWIQAFDNHPGLRWAVYHEDAFEFLSIVLALWQLGKTACVPGDNSPGTVARLELIVDGFAGQFDTVVISPGQCSNVGRNVWKRVDKHYDALEIYTSGSTGIPTPIPKSLHQLESELATIDALWNSSDAVVVSTVSHHHFYGMMFRLFWPFSTGRAFATHLCPCSEDVFFYVSKFTSFQLVTSPTLLSRLNPEIEWRSIQQQCEKIISSAAPLSRVESMRAYDLLGVEINEIYGSSESGAVAWRCQQAWNSEALWKSLPNVFLSRGTRNNLLVKSAYQKEEGFCEMSDVVDLVDDQRFRLLGRLDRIAKIEGKRVALNAIEKHLQRCEYVHEAKVLVLEGRRTEVAAVLKMSEEGWGVLKKLGRKSLLKEYRKNLLRELEAVVIPRKWRFVKCFPCDPQGKVTIEKLKIMFDKKPKNWPTITGVEVLDNTVALTCYTQEELVYFDGHFDGNPILPGVVQVHWACEMAGYYLGVDRGFIKLEVVKFQQIITPYRILKIKLRFDSQKKKLHFCYESDKGVHSSGRICYG